ncbi:bifunctional adenosylcobinamide kinase/adenosylcobinamide-phosphate guanylyltransferase [Rubrivivax gelatinosus]|uniref:Bifunctional adenosylcobalamin biosynthesis protein n=1 Tax=Rubrivivax gelatinosus TaxID=28068 RepID=A0A4R2MCU7_RUBGE|nr:bifunctional adenosylcobinamide kinase/adenosylcobinamide-phosphate guanylyltransferase [Rubrivivax gelatinosus]MBK1689811.1 adenosylcobinamide-phosphate guanylyltransferase [Rubrivivax gelatinosus]TCP02264.1 adenosylcobinamide kinase /adenosylcobinamide-phosphate guanylyltransferase [Rubrivivax gelatinosus]
MHELILGGAKSGKSRCAEMRAAHWLALPGHGAVLVATALAGDDEMRARIERHRADRAARVPGLATREEPRALAAALREESVPGRMVVVDCLTLWLTGLLMPLDGAPVGDPASEVDALLAALKAARGPVVLVSNEIGLGVMPMTREARRFVDELGRLHQRVGAECARVTMMVAGLELPLKGPR